MTERPVHLFEPCYRTKEVLEEIRECLDKGWTSLGYKTLEFERAWKDFTGLPHAHMVNSATVGLHLAVRLLKQRYGWQSGDEVITTPFTFVATNHVLLYEGLQPVFADIDSHLCLDPESIGPRVTPKTRAVMFVGIGGNTGQLKRVAAMCRRMDLRLIIDGAHMAGTYLNSSHIGAEGDVAVFSFHAVKNLPTADSGMVCFMDAGLDTKARQLSWLGIDRDTYQRSQGGSPYKWMYDVIDVGYKYHGNSVMAAMGLVGLRYLEHDNARRRLIADWYEELFQDVDYIERVPVAKGCHSSRHLYQVGVPYRDEVVEVLNSHHIYPGVHYRDNTEYTMYQYAQGTCPLAHAWSTRVLSLPIHMGLTFEDVERVSRTLTSTVSRLLYNR